MDISFPLNDRTKKQPSPLVQLWMKGYRDLIANNLKMY